MRTYLLSDDDVRRYLTDFVQRLTALSTSGYAPEVILCLGNSGDKLYDDLGKLAGGQAFWNDADRAFLGYDRKTSQIFERRKGERVDIDPSDFRGKHLILLDSAVHSGRSMADCVIALSRLGASDILTYSLVLKRNSQFIPNFFGLVINEHDRPYFQLDVLPNNRLRSTPLFGHLRALREGDLNDKTGWLNTGVPSIDRVTLSDLWYQAKKGCQVFIYEVQGRIAGVVQFRCEDKGGVRSLIIDLIAVHSDFRDQGFGSPMIRWACTYARASRCIFVDLDTHQDQRAKYEKFGFRATGAETCDLGNGEVYRPMRKKIIYASSPLTDEPWSDQRSAP